MKIDMQWELHSWIHIESFLPHLYVNPASMKFSKIILIIETHTYQYFELNVLLILRSDNLLL